MSTKLNQINCELPDVDIFFFILPNPFILFAFLSSLVNKVFYLCQASHFTSLLRAELNAQNQTSGWISECVNLNMVVVMWIRVLCALIDRPRVCLLLGLCFTH